MQRLAKVYGVVRAARILVAENADAEQADHGGDAIAIVLQVFVSGVTPDIEVHFDTANELVEVFKGKLILRDDGSQLLVYGEAGSPALAGDANVGPPFLEQFSPGGGGLGFVIRRVIHFPAKGIQGSHAGSLRGWQEDERQREVGGAFARDRLADLPAHVFEGGV